MIRSIIAVAAVAVLAGCTTPISNNLPQDISQALGTGANSPVITDFTDAQYNLTQAIAVGALPANDPGAACLNSVATMLNIGGTPAVSFVPKIGGTYVLSGASVLYIRYNQVAALAGGNLEPTAQCEQLMGKLQWDTLKAALQGANLAAPALGIPSIPGLGRTTPVAAPTTIAPPPLPSAGHSTMRMIAPTGIVVSDADSNPSLGGK